MGLGPDSVGVGLFRSERDRIGNSAAGGAEKSPRPPRRRRQERVFETETR